MDISHSLIQASASFDVFGAPGYKIFARLPLFLWLVPHIWILSWVECLYVHFSNQFANLGLALYDFIRSFLIAKGELLKLGSGHDWVLAAEFSRYSH